NPAGAPANADRRTNANAIAVAGAQRFPDVSTALLQNPASLILAGVSLTETGLRALDEKVAAGLRVLWLEAPPRSALPAPLKLAAGHQAAFAFIRRPGEPLVRDLTDGDLALWRGDGIVARNALRKPSTGVFDIIADCGSPQGLSRAAILRLHRGRGFYLFCQMPLSAAQAAHEPVANLLLSRLVQELSAPPDPPRHPVALLAGADSPLRASLRMLAIPFEEATAVAPGSGLWLVDGATPAPPAPCEASLLKKHLDAGGRAMLQRLTPATAAPWFSVLGLQGALVETRATQVVRHTDLYTGSSPLDGLTNDDFYWTLTGKTPGPSILSHALALDPPAPALVSPAGLVVAPAYNGKLLLCQLRWDELHISFPDRAARILRTLLRNQGADLGDGHVVSRHYTPVDLKPAANAAWTAPRGWFRTQPDLTYFPVNRTGIDPVLGVPQPPEPFDPLLHSDDVPIRLTDPERNQGRGALVIGPATGGFEEEARITLANPAEQAPRIEDLWLAGATNAGPAIPEGTRLATLTFAYADGETRTIDLRTGKELGAFGTLTQLERGRIFWTGPGGGKRRVHLYAWPAFNPRPAAPVQALHFRITPVDTHTALGIVGATISTTAP
ncbi:MAG: hypothetical protein LBK99_09625, partial [Opitutaceae bacterium]|nr:hypothetical protein [Opitutaceae bacterium]